MGYFANQAVSIGLLITALAHVGLSQSSASDVVGTWTSKSNQVFTGPGFYDPVEELLIEPSLPGISYSFTEDGFFEQASYRVKANPRDPKCPTAVLTFQHGKYRILDNGTMILTPFEVDGRQLVSDPCKDNGTSMYTRYHQVETFRSFVVEVHPYHGKLSLQIYGFDGAPEQPLYLAYRPPMMLPTHVLNPTSGGGPKKRGLRELVRRGLENRYRTNADQKRVDASNYWWLSVGLIGLGTIAFFAV